MLNRAQTPNSILWRRILLSIAALIVAVWCVRRDRVETPCAGLLAAALLVISCAVLLRTAAKTGSLMNGQTLVLGTFLVAYPLSAFVHLTGSNYESIGFYNLAALDPHTQAHHVYLSLALVLVALLALWWGLAPARPPLPPAVAHAVRVRSALLVLFGIAFTLVGAAGTALLFSGSGEGLADLANIDRARELESGTARFVFMSQWLSWGIVFLLTAFLASRFSNRRPRFTLIALIGGSACMVVNLFWTGGRAENLLAILPLMFVVKKLRPGVFRPFTAIVVAGLSGIIVFETIARTTVLLDTGMDLLARSGIGAGQFVANQIAAVFDWQMGRYPTIGLAFDMVNRSGHAFGSTLIQGLAMTLNAPATLLHSSMKAPEPAAMTALAGQYIYGDPNMTGVVPGTLAELYFNFGILGVAVGFFVIGRIARYCISVTHSSREMGTRLLAFYILTLLCVWTIPMTATLGVYLLATRGLPILLFCAAEQTVSRAAHAAQQHATAPALP